MKYLQLLPLLILCGCQTQTDPVSSRSKQLCEDARIDFPSTKCTNYVNLVDQRIAAEREAAKQSSKTPEEVKQELKTNLYHACINRINNRLAEHNSDHKNVFNQIQPTFEDVYKMKEFCKCESEHILKQVSDTATPNIMADEIEADVWLSKIQSDATKKCSSKFSIKSKKKK